MPLQDQLAEVLDLQQHYARRDSLETTRRNGLVQDGIPNSLREALLGSTFAIDSEFLRVYGSGGAGLNAKIPWVLISDERFTKRAQDGWYLVLLFSENGSGLYLSLNKNSTVSGPNPSGKWTADPLPDYEMRRDRGWALSLLDERIQATQLELTETMDLHTTSAPGRAYEKTHVVGRHYPRSALPDEEELVSDLSAMSVFLNIIYNSLSGGSASSEVPVPSPTDGGSSNSEKAETSTTTGGPGRQSDTAVKLATEQHAEKRATKYLEDEPYRYEKVKNVGAVKSYDLQATKGSEILCVEVKGSISSLSSVNLTANEVATARTAKNTLLVVVDQITWQRTPSGEIVTSGGRMRTWWGWRADENLLTPTEYRYELPPEQPDETPDDEPPAAEPPNPLDGRY